MNILLRRDVENWAVLGVEYFIWKMAKSIYVQYLSLETHLSLIVSVIYHTSYADSFEPKVITRVGPRALFSKS